MVWEMRLSLSGQSTLRANLNKNRIKVIKYTATSIGQKVLLHAVRWVCFANLTNKRKQKSLNLGPPCIKSHLMDDDALAPPL